MKKAELEARIIELEQKLSKANKDIEELSALALQWKETALVACKKLGVELKVIYN